jgi:hypothetical protein
MELVYDENPRNEEEAEITSQFDSLKVQLLKGFEKINISFLAQNRFVLRKGSEVIQEGYWNYNIMKRLLTISPKPPEKRDQNTFVAANEVIRCKKKEMEVFTNALLWESGDYKTESGEIKEIRFPLDVYFKLTLVPYP